MRVWADAEQGDYVVQREFTTSAPAHTTGGSFYARYQLGSRAAIAGRTEYMSDRGGLFTGASQAIKEATVTFEQRLAGGLLLREEWRRDGSNHPYFLTNTLGNLKKAEYGCGRYRLVVRRQRGGVVARKCAPSSFAEAQLFVATVAAHSTS
jgi:hypothetical protein